LVIHLAALCESPLALALALIVATGSMMADESTEGLSPDDHGWTVLDSDDGWGAFSTGTTGGSLATFDHVFRVHNRAELAAALSLGSVSKITKATKPLEQN
jgi:hypothetical protein